MAILTKSIIYNTITGQTCSFAYLVQPLSTTLQSCNPYSQHRNDIIVAISLGCTVRRHSTVNTNYSIEWFRENTDGLVQCLGLGDPVSQQSITDRSSRYHDKKFINQPYSPSLLGKYWCQVINTTADPDQPLMRSNVFTLLAPLRYNEPMCTTVQADNNISCADLPDHDHSSLTSFTKTLSLTTTQSVLCNIGCIRLGIEYAMIKKFCATHRNSCYQHSIKKRHNLTTFTIIGTHTHAHCD